MSETLVGNEAAGADEPVSERELVEGLFNTLLDLVEVLETEIDCVRARDGQEMALCQEEKRTLATAYEANLRSLRRRPDALKNLNAQDRADMRVLTDRFQEALVANERALRAARAAADGVLQTIARAAQEERATFYGERGTPRTARDKRAIPLSLNSRY